MLAHLDPLGQAQRIDNRSAEWVRVRGRIELQIHYVTLHYLEEHTYFDSAGFTAERVRRDLLVNLCGGDRRLNGQSDRIASATAR